MSSFSILIPVYNEEAILEASFKKLSSFLSEKRYDYEIIFGSNGSDDSTLKILEELSKANHKLKFIDIPEKAPGKAFIEMVKISSYEKLITLDADLSSDLSFIDHAALLLDYCEMVVGSKTLGAQRRTLTRVLGSQLYITLAQLIFKLTISDYSIGCKAFKKSAILPYLNNLDSWTGYIFELSYLLTKNGNKIIQVGVDCDDQRKSRFNLLYEGYYRFKHLAEMNRKLREQPGTPSSSSANNEVKASK
jgi:glycosyltransferase involved in cell wall biosynthesis